MKFLVALAVRPDADPAILQQARGPSGKALWQLYLKDVVREMYVRQDNKGVVFMAEGTSAEAIGQAIAQLPLVQSGQVTGDVIGLLPFPDLASAFQA